MACVDVKSEDRFRARKLGRGYVDNHVHLTFLRGACDCTNQQHCAGTAGCIAPCPDRVYVTRICSYPLPVNTQYPCGHRTTPMTDSVSFPCQLFIAVLPRSCRGRWAVMHFATEHLPCSAQSAAAAYRLIASMGQGRVLRCIKR